VNVIVANISKGSSKSTLQLDTIQCTLLGNEVVFCFSLSGWACRYDVSSIGKVISVERVCYGNLFFSTVFDVWSN